MAATKPMKNRTAKRPRVMDRDQYQPSLIRVSHWVGGQLQAPPFGSRSGSKQAVTNSQTHCTAMGISHRCRCMACRGSAVRIRLAPFLFRQFIEFRQGTFGLFLQHLDTSYFSFYLSYPNPFLYGYCKGFDQPTCHLIQGRLPIAKCSPDTHGRRVLARASQGDYGSRASKQAPF